MVKNPKLNKVIQNLMPGEITAGGFLGDDNRSLLDIIEHDEEKMIALGLDFKEIGLHLNNLMLEGRKGLGSPIDFDPEI